MTKNLLVMGNQMLAAEMEALDQHFDCLHLWKEKDPEAALQEHRDTIKGIASIIAVPVSKKLIEALPNLEIISTYSVGYDHIDWRCAQERGVVVTNTPDVLTEDTADTAMVLLLNSLRRGVEADVYVRVGKWLNGEMPLGVSLKDKKVGIAGLGRIGQAIAKRCKGFDVKVAYYGRREKPDQPYPYYDDLEDLARHSDILILAVPGGQATAGLVDAHILDALGPKGFLINIARGSVVDEPALVQALREKRIAGAGLDVYQNEPHVPEDLISMDNVVLLPHIGSATIETRTAMGQLVVHNLLAHFKGEKVLTPVF